MRARVLVGIGLVVVGLVAVGLVVADDDPPGDPVRAESPTTVATTMTTTTTTTAASEGPTPTMLMGEVGEIAVEVTPRTGLTDGQVLTLVVDGVDGLPDDAIVLMCTGGVRDASNAAAHCDPTSVTAPDGTVGPELVEGEQQVVVNRYLRTAGASGDPNYPGPFDCATDPLGCGLVLAPYRLPPTAVSVPLAFDDAPTAPAAVVVTPATGLDDGAVATVEASGLRPLADHRISQCVPREGERPPGEDWRCDWETTTTLTSDADGALLGAFRVRPAIYPAEGRIDCTATPCSLVVASDASGAPPAAAEIGFADGVVAPEPRITLDPPGPYVDGQEITLHGSGFPPGRDLSGHIGQCPADRDTRVEERCTYDLDPVVVAEDGTFTTTRAVHAALLFTGACADTGCVIGWVITKGATVAAVPIEVR